MDNDESLFGTGLFDLEEDNLSQKNKCHLREGELREVTMLFADIKGFTDLSTRFDPEIIHLKMDELMKVFSRCITFYGGFVDKYMGDGIMALFGAKKASEQDSERAIRAGLKMQQQLIAYNAYLNKQPGFENVELGLRIGINTGMVSVGKVGESREGDFTVYGPEVNLASRMESNAPVNGIMLPAATKKLVDHVFEFVALGQKQVKGIEVPIECWQPKSLKIQSLPRWQRLNSRFIGREIELGLLSEAFAQIKSPRSDKRTKIIGIEAEAGMGKTRLVYEFRKYIECDAVFITAACNSVSPTPLNLFANLFENYFVLRINETPPEKLSKLELGFAALKEGATDEQQAALDDAFAMIAFLLEIKTADARIKQGGKDLLQHLLQAAESVLRIILTSAAATGLPIVFIIDDLHWMDESSAAALEHIISHFSESDYAQLWLLLYRQDYSLPAYLSRSEHFILLELHHLDEQDIANMIFNYGRQLDLSEDTIDRVVQLSAGNPFFLEEWCNYIADLAPDDMQDLPVPANLHALILSRLDNLPLALRLLLQKASVIGQEFFVEILREVEKRLEDSLDVDRTLASLEQQAMIMKMLGFDYSSYFFKHVTTREVAYQTLLHSNRKILHRLAGEAIEDIFPDRLEEFHFALAEHFVRGEITDKATHYLEKAADAAAKIYNNTQALELYHQLLQLLDPQEHEKRGAVLLKIAEILWLNGDWTKLEEILQQMLIVSEKTKDLTLRFNALRLSGLLCFFRRKPEDAKSHWDECLVLANQLQDKLLLCVALNFLGVWHQHHREFDAAIDLHSRSMELAEKLGEQARIAKTLNNLGLIYLEQKDFAKAEHSFEESLRLAEESRLLKDESLAIGNLGHAMILQKRYLEAIPYLNRKLALAEKMNDRAELIKALGNMGMVDTELMRHEEALKCYQSILRIKEFMGDSAGMTITQESIESLEKLLPKKPQFKK
ncbi:MAG: adenylate/guanylate cyclase domain-containing protein [Candidatus Cloacimonadaceae bacterium]|nr:adenylate/guanylate cyclase domain-containing protein [Candidatus Cloacimonadaceae bacterium]